MKSKQSYKTRVTSSPGESCSHRDLYVNTFSKWFGMTNALQLMMCVMPCSRSVARSRATASPATKTLGATRVQCFSKCANFSAPNRELRGVRLAGVAQGLQVDGGRAPAARADVAEAAAGPASAGPNRGACARTGTSRMVARWGTKPTTRRPRRRRARRARARARARPAGRVVGMGLSAIGASSRASRRPIPTRRTPHRGASLGTQSRGSWTLTVPCASPREVNGAASPSPRATPLRFSPRPTIALRRTVRRTAATVASRCGAHRVHDSWQQSDIFCDVAGRARSCAGPFRGGFAKRTKNDTLPLLP